MKWYFAINDRGAAGATGLHAKLAVLTARKVGLSGHLLYTGERGALTAWMEHQGVAVIDTAPRLLPAIAAAQRAGRHPPDRIGHWLRVDVCLVEAEDEFVLYTDCDVIFRKSPDLTQVRPECIACAPEFRPDNWNYFNAGVMVENIPSLRRDYEAFEHHVREILGSDRAPGYNDQYAYNEFYRSRWTRLDPRLNWKPYWGFQEAASIVHYHGPKLDTMRAILDGTLGWESDHGRQIGSLFVSALPHYIAHLQDLMAILQDEAFEAHELVGSIIRDAQALRRQVPMERIDLSFLNFHLFPG